MKTPVNIFTSLLLTAAASVLLTCNPLHAASIFASTNIGLPGLAYSSVAWGDLDGDGRRDLLLTGSDTAFNNFSAIMKNSGSGLLTNINAGIPGLSSSAVAWGDMDNDGKPDLLLTGLTGIDANNFPIFVSQVWRNLGNGTFTNLNVPLPGVDTGAVAWGDFDNDGWFDILITGYMRTGPVSQVWRNLGNGSFSNINATLTSVLYSSVARADFDGDGAVDILLTGTTNGFLGGAISQVWRNLGQGTFTNLNVTLPAVSQGSVAVADYDADGRPDILITGYSSAGPIAQVWRNRGGGSFSNLNLSLPGVYQSSVAWADFDNDGKLDFVLTGSDSNSVPISQVWRNTGNGAFTNFLAALPGVRSGSAAWGDFDNDGKLDLVLTGLSSNSVPVTHAFRNGTPMRGSSAPRIAGGNALVSGGFRFSFAGSVGTGYSVFASTNLTQTNAWKMLGSPQETTPGFHQFTDPTIHPIRFYQVRTP